MSAGFNDKPEDSWRERWWPSLICLFFHQAFRYMFRSRTYDDDRACSKCKVQWIG